MDIVALSGSVSNKSYNTALLNAISQLSPDHINVTVLESLQNIPTFSPDIEDQLMPELVASFIDKIRRADGLIICAPEYAHGISGVLKNALDWMVSSDALVLKPVVIMTVSTSGLGGVRAFSSLVQILSAMNSHVVIDASLCIPYAKLKFDDSLNLVDEITIKAIDVSLLSLERTIDQRNA
ncbi:MAG: NAD(P)H-dependent oxidoreductase [Gammaproteobacteria bacterium]|nr:NAD(P)H-dependent oxidoreductase [Gammaproteobacteria bacterium]